jgi:hypothetical protein
MIRSFEQVVAVLQVVWEVLEIGVVWPGLEQ